MTVGELQEALGLRAVVQADPGREVTGGYAGDLLSRVMSHAKGGDAWVTIMTNRNVVAVAMLTDVAAVVFAEGVEPDADAVAAAEARGINLLVSEQPAFALCKALGARL